MVWGTISHKGVGKLVRIDGNLNADGYIELLEDNLEESIEKMGMTGERWIFQQDGAPCHTAKKVKDWFEANEVPVMSWPAQSPDLNPIGENISNFIFFCNSDFS